MKNKPYVEISKKLIIINSISSVITRVIEVSFLVWLYQYLLRNITPEEYSLLPVVMSIMVLMPLVTVFLTSGISRYIIVAYAKGEKERVSSIVSSIFPFLMLSSFILLILGGLFTWRIDSFLNIPQGRLTDARWMLFLLLISFLYNLSTLPFCVGPDVKQRFVVLNLFNLAQNLVKIVITFVLFWAFDIWIVWVVVAQTASSILFNTVRLLYSRSILPCLKYRLRLFDFGTAKPIFSFGFWSFLGQASYTLRMAMDAIILNLYSTPMQITCFHIGSSFRRQSEALVNMISNNLQPAFIAMHSTQRKKNFLNTYHRGNRYMMWIMLFMAMPLMIYRKELIYLYVGPDYQTAAEVLCLLFLPSLFGSSLLMVWKAAHAMGRIRGTTIYAICNQLITLAFTLYLVRNLKMGAVGSALSTFIFSLLGSVLVLLPISVKLLSISYSDWFRQSFFPGIIPAVFGGFVWFGLYFWHPPSTWSELAIFFAIGAIVYFVVLYFLALDKYEKEDLHYTFGKYAASFKKLRVYNYTK